jgi:hypothetical protein
LKLRLDLEGQLEALLTDTQKKQWKEMLGSPVDLSVLFDGLSSPQDVPGDTRKRLTAKVEQVKEGMQKWADSGRDPSDIGKAMAEKFKPLMDAGKVVEAEAELDSLLTQLNEDAK